MNSIILTLAMINHLINKINQDKMVYTMVNFRNRNEFILHLAVEKDNICSYIRLYKNNPAVIAEHNRAYLVLFTHSNLVAMCGDWNIYVNYYNDIQITKCTKYGQFEIIYHLKMI